MTLTPPVNRTLNVDRPTHSSRSGNDRSSENPALKRATYYPSPLRRQLPVSSGLNVDKSAYHLDSIKGNSPIRSPANINRPHPSPSVKDRLFVLPALNTNTSARYPSVDALSTNPAIHENKLPCSSSPIEDRLNQSLPVSKVDADAAQYGESSNHNYKRISLPSKLVNDIVFRPSERLSRIKQGYHKYQQSCKSINISSNTVEPAKKLQLASKQNLLLSQNNSSVLDEELPMDWEAIDASAVVENVIISVI